MFLNMEKLIQCKNGPEPLKSKGLRDSSLSSAVVLIVEKGRISCRSRQMGAYQHTKPNGHTIPEMNRVTVQWERVIVYRESCDSRLLQSKRPFFGPFWPDVPPTPRRSGLCPTRAGEGATAADTWEIMQSLFSEPMSEIIEWFSFVCEELRPSDRILFPGKYFCKSSERQGFTVIRNPAIINYCRFKFRVADESNGLGLVLLIDIPLGRVFVSEASFL